MKENLRVTRYRNGDDITNVADAGQWVNLTTGAWCVYDNDPANADIYGLMYNWHAVNDSRNIAPAGWHVPTDEEWKQLEMTVGLSRYEADLLGGRSNAGMKLKTIGEIDTETGLWSSPNSATNESCFSALPGGIRYDDHGAYQFWGGSAFFWSTSELNQLHAYARLLQIDSAIFRYYYSKDCGLAVRCVRDL